VSSWESDLLTGIAQLLNDQAVGVYKTTGTYAATDTAIVFGELPTSPDRCIGLSLYSATDAPKQNLSTVRLQVMMRGAVNNSLDVGDLATAVFGVLQGLEGRDFGTAHAVQVGRISAVPLGLDSNKRSERSDNYQADINTPYTTYRTP
jgi:hypothetical protein